VEEAAGAVARLREVLAEGSGAPLEAQREALLAAVGLPLAREEAAALVQSLPPGERREQLCRAAGTKVPAGSFDVHASSSFGEALEAEVWLDGELLGKTPYFSSARLCVSRLEVVEPGTGVRDVRTVTLSARAASRVAVRFPGRPTLNVVSLVGEVSRVERSWTRGDFANAGLRYERHGQLLAFGAALKGGVHRPGGDRGRWELLPLPQVDAYVGTTHELALTRDFRLHVFPAVGVSSLILPTLRLGLTGNLDDRWALTLAGQLHYMPQFILFEPTPEALFVSASVGVGRVF
jgi:hypothetical protein